MARQCTRDPPRYHPDVWVKRRHEVTHFCAIPRVFFMVPRPSDAGSDATVVFSPLASRFMFAPPHFGPGTRGPFHLLLDGCSPSARYSKGDWMRVSSYQGTAIIKRRKLPHISSWRDKRVFDALCLAWPVITCCSLNDACFRFFFTKQSIFILNFTVLAIQLDVTIQPLLRPKYYSNGSVK